MPQPSDLNRRITPLPRSYSTSAKPSRFWPITPITPGSGAISETTRNCTFRSGSSAKLTVSASAMSTVLIPPTPLTM